MADLPDRFDAMTVKELRQGLRANRFLVPFFAIHAGMLLTCAGEGTSQLLAGTSLLGDDTPGIVAFWLVAGLALVIVLPATRFFDLQQEIDGRNGELLLLAGLDRWSIVWGKWRVCVALGLLTMVSLLPYLFFFYALGGLELPVNLLLGFLLILQNAVLSALVIGASAFKNFAARLIALGAGFWSVAITLGGVSTGLIIILKDGSGFWFFFPVLLLNACAVTILYVVLGLQLARVRMRTFRDPGDPAPGGQVMALYFFTPFLVGIPGSFSFGVLSIVASLFFAWIGRSIDPPPRKRLYHRIQAPAGFAQD